MMRMGPALGAMVAAAAVALPAPAQDESGPQISEYLGAIGPYRIGMNITVAPDHRTVLRAHYFYASKLADIPLRPVAAGDAVVLGEAGGGVFHLHFVGNGSAKPPLDFYTSVGLAGAWTQGARTLPVKLQLDTGRDEPAPGRWYALITKAPDAQVEANARRFLQGVIGGDRDAAAGAVSYPLQVNGRRSYRIADRAALLAHWDAIFTPAYVAVLKTAVPHEMFVNDRGAMVANGAVWFDDKGASALNLASAQ